MPKRDETKPSGVVNKSGIGFKKQRTMAAAARNHPIKAFGTKGISPATHGKGVRLASLAEKGINPSSTFARKRRQAMFLKAFANSGIIKAAAEFAGVGTSQVRVWLERYPDFKEKFNKASEESADELEKEAWRRAVRGVKKLKVHQGQFLKDPRDKTGKSLYYEREYSDQLLIVLLRARRPERFKDGSTQINNQQKLVLAPITLDGEASPKGTKQIQTRALTDEEKQRVRDSLDAPPEGELIDEPEQELSCEPEPHDDETLPLP